jgi:hypothetical protein
LPPFVYNERERKT